MRAAELPVSRRRYITEAQRKAIQRQHVEIDERTVRWLDMATMTWLEFAVVPDDDPRQGTIEELIDVF